MSYIETAARYTKIVEGGKVKKVTERFLVDALSCTEAEARTIAELTPCTTGELEVTVNKKVNIAEVMGDKEATRFYLAKVAVISVNEKSGIEKRTATRWLVGAEDFSDAYRILNEEIGKCMADIEIQSLAETPIKEFYQHK